VQSQVEELYSLLVPLHHSRLIVPRSCITEIIRFVPPEIPAGGPDWFLGFTSWQDLEVPVVRMEALCGLASAEPGGRTRLAIFNCLSGAIDAGVFGVLTEGFPQLVRVNRDVMTIHEEQAWPEDGPIICQIRMINEYPLIPDLERVESLIEAHLAQAA
jgi:chemosensory pili system protein ChpC